MRASDFITESKKIKEKAPVGLGSQVWSAVKGAFGSTQGKASADVGSRATQIYQKFNNQALRTGVDMSMVPVKTLQKWFKEQGLVFPKDAVSGATALDLTDKTTSNHFWTAAAQQAYAKGATGAKLGSQYGIPAKPKKAKAAAGAGGSGGGGGDFKSLKNTLAGAKGTLSPNQINALIKTLTGP